MAVLSDTGIIQAIQQDKLGVTPFELASVQPASLDVRLGAKLRVPNTQYIQVYDPQNPPREEDYQLVDIATQPYPLKFGNFVLGATYESIGLGPDLTAHIDGISSLGRLGLVIHSGSCWIDPGFHGTITLELSIGSNTPVLLRAGMRIGQLVVETVEPPAHMLYGSPGLKSKYQGQQLPGIARSEHQLRMPGLGDDGC